jgi:hypothetical protein
MKKHVGLCMSPRICTKVPAYTVLWLIFDTPPSELLRPLHVAIARATALCGIKHYDDVVVYRLRKDQEIGNEPLPENYYENTFKAKRVMAKENALASATCEELRPCEVFWDARRRGTNSPIDDYNCFVHYSDPTYQWDPPDASSVTSSPTRASIQLSVRCALFRDNEPLMHDVMRTFVDAISDIADIHSGIMHSDLGDVNNSGRVYVHGIDGYASYSHAWSAARVAHATHEQSDSVPGIGSWTIVGKRLMARWKGSSSIISEYNALKITNTFIHCQHRAWMNTRGIAIFQAAGDPFSEVRERPAHWGQLQRCMGQSAWLYWKMREANMIM